VARGSAAHPESRTATPTRATFVSERGPATVLVCGLVCIGRLDSLWTFVEHGRTHRQATGSIQSRLYGNCEVLRDRSGAPVACEARRIATVPHAVDPSPRCTRRRPHYTIIVAVVVPCMSKLRSERSEVGQPQHRAQISAQVKRGPALPNSVRYTPNADRPSVGQLTTRRTQVAPIRTQAIAST
jgi:hypothetical protein